MKNKEKEYYLCIVNKGNNLKEIPKNVQIINCHYFDLENLGIFRDFKSLETFRCSRNGLSSLRDIPNSLPKTLREFWCTSNTLYSLDGIEYFEQLKKLVISFNRFLFHGAMSINLEPLSSLTFLEVLNLYYNNIKSLKYIENLKFLRVLNCEGNLLTSENLKSALKGFNNLKILNCKKNEIRDFNFIGKSLRGLELLDCSENTIAGHEEKEACDLFGGLENLKELKWFKCSHCHITVKNFFWRFSHLTKLQKLSVHDNQISGSLIGLQNLTNLKGLIYHDNPIISMKGHPINMGMKYVFNYDFYYYWRMNYDYDSYPWTMSDIFEVSGTSKFTILLRLSECHSSFFSWALRDKNNLNKLYDYF